MRARQPDSSGYVVNDGVRVYYEVHGTGSPMIVLMPSWAITQSRMWKMQVPYLARHFRVLTYDPRGNGRSDRPGTAAAYDADRIVDDALAVMDATGTDDAVLVGLCTGALWATMLQQREPGRVLGLVAIAPTLTLDPPVTDLHPVYDFEAELDTDEGWAKENRRVLEARLGGLHPLLHQPAGVGAALDQGVRRHGRVGAGHGRGDDAARRGLLVLAGPDDGRRSGPSCAARSPARCWRSPAPRTGTSRRDGRCGWPS